jgi:TolA-binding protein
MFASDRLPRSDCSVKALDLSGPVSDLELMRSGQLGGRLYPTRKADPSARDLVNLSFARAMQLWNTHRYPEAVKRFREHIEAFPESPWVSEARLHIGCDARYHGRYTEAEELFLKIIDKNRARLDNSGAMALTNKARARLGVLYYLKNNPEAANHYFAMLRKDGSDWRDRTYAAQ